MTEANPFLKLMNHSQALMLYMRATECYRKGQVDEALSLHNQALEIAESSEDDAVKSLVLHEIGVIHTDRGEFETASNFHYQSLEISKRIADIGIEALSLHQLGIVRCRQKQFDEAIHFLKQSLEVGESLSKDGLKAETLHELAIVYSYLEDLETALTFHYQSLEISERIGNFRGSAETLYSLALIYIKLNQLETAIDCYSRSQIILGQIGDFKKQKEFSNQLRDLLPDDQKNEESKVEEQRYQAFLNVIEDLLKCSSGIEGLQILQVANRHLYGLELMQAILSVAVKKEKSDERSADILIWFAYHALASILEVQSAVERFLLSQGVKVWNRWRKNNPRIIPDLSGINLWMAQLEGVNLSFAKFDKADLRMASLMDADLRGADFRDANLYGVRLSHADLSEANFSGAKLSQADLRRAKLCGTWLRGTDFSRASLNFEGILSKMVNAFPSLNDGADLTEADLSGADLTEANLSGANLSEANLNGAVLAGARLVRTQLVGANLSGATLTGVCLEDWHISSSTNLDKVVSDYVYLKADKQERRPRDGNFAPSEFTKLFQKVLETVDLIFADGIDWKAFFTSFEELRTKYGNENLSIQAIEKKSHSAFVIRLEVSPEVDKVAIEARAKEFYGIHLKLLEEQYQEKLRLQGAHLKDARQTIETERQEKANLMEILTTMANKQGSKYDMRNSTFGNFVDTAQTGSRQQVVQHIYSSGHHQSLAESAREIQELLDQLSRTYPPTEVPAKAEEAIKNNPQLKGRVVGAIKQGGKKALEELIKHPAVAILLAAIEGWEKMPNS
jgi:uncharacterized protein YjbI with pentapeptide repeats/tetratricopeptide (TPR) repeat protein